MLFGLFAQFLLVLGIHVLFPDLHFRSHFFLQSPSRVLFLHYSLRFGFDFGFEFFLLNRFRVIFLQNGSGRFHLLQAFAQSGILLVARRERSFQLDDASAQRRDFRLHVLQMTAEGVLPALQSRLQSLTPLMAQQQGFYETGKVSFVAGVVVGEYGQGRAEIVD